MKSQTFYLFADAAAFDAFVGDSTEIPNTSCANKIC